MSLFDASKIKYRDPSERDVSRLFWRDDMEEYDTCKWTKTGSDTVVKYVNNIPAYEGNGVLSISRASSGYMGAYLLFGCVKGKTAFELRWYSRKSISNIAVGLLRSGAVHGEGLRSAVNWGKRLDKKQGWMYRDVNFAWKDVVGGVENVANDAWNYVKLIVDWERRRYHRLVTNLLDIDLSSLALNQYNEPTLGFLQPAVDFYIASGTSLPYPCYIDDARLYLDEE